MRHAHGLFHFYSRKSSHKKHRSSFLKFIDRFIYLVVFVDIVMTIPQLLQIWLEKDASGVSAISWGAYILTSGFWLAYGLSHRIKPIVVSAILWIIIQLFIVIGVLIYG